MTKTEQKIITSFVGASSKLEEFASQFDFEFYTCNSKYRLTETMNAEEYNKLKSNIEAAKHFIDNVFYELEQTEDTNRNFNQIIEEV